MADEAPFNLLSTQQPVIIIRLRSQYAQLDEFLLGLGVAHEAHLHPNHIYVCPIVTNQQQFDLLMAMLLATPMLKWQTLKSIIDSNDEYILAPIYTNRRDVEAAQMLQRNVASFTYLMTNWRNYATAAHAVCVFDLANIEPILGILDQLHGITNRADLAAIDIADIADLVLTLSQEMQQRTIMQPIDRRVTNPVFNKNDNIVYLLCVNVTKTLLDLIAMHAVIEFNHATLLTAVSYVIDRARINFAELVRQSKQSIFIPYRDDQYSTRLL